MGGRVPGTSTASSPAFAGSDFRFTSPQPFASLCRGSEVRSEAVPSPAATQGRRGAEMACRRRGMPSAPRGLRNKARGCREAATPGIGTATSGQPQRQGRAVAGGCGLLALRGRWGGPCERLAADASPATSNGRTLPGPERSGGRHVRGAGPGGAFARRRMPRLATLGARGGYRVAFHGLKPVATGMPPSAPLRAPWREQAQGHVATQPAGLPEQKARSCTPHYTLHLTPEDLPSKAACLTLTHRALPPSPPQSPRPVRSLRRRGRGR